MQSAIWLAYVDLLTEYLSGCIAASMQAACWGKAVTIQILQISYAHRDLRWDVTACSLERHYFLLDLELCGEPGRASFMLKTWPKGILQADGAYTLASDLLAVKCFAQ